MNFNARYVTCLRALVSVSNRCTFTLFIFTIPRTNEINRNFDMLANKLLAKEFASFLSIVCLLRVGESENLSKGVNGRDAPLTWDP